MLNFLRRKFVYVVAILLVVDFALFGYGPSMERLKNLRQTQNIHEKIMANSMKQHKNLVALRDQMRHQNEQFLQWEVRIPKEREMGQAIKNLSQLMSQYHLVDQRITPGNEYRVDRLGVIPVTIHCCGELEQMFGFYRELQQGERLVRVQSLMLQRQKAVPGGIEMTTEVVLFYGDPTFIGQAS